MISTRGRVLTHPWDSGLMPLLVSRSSLSRYQQFKDFQRRILVATNLFGRGMDIERVNIVFNYDMPEDSDTYLHRVSASSQCGWDQGLPHPSSDTEECLSPDPVSVGGSCWSLWYQGPGSHFCIG